MEQIIRLHKELLADRTFFSRKYLILSLQSMMPTVNQWRQVFDRPPHGVRIIILLTNIAENSHTIDDVVKKFFFFVNEVIFKNCLILQVFVIDRGKVKQSAFDSKRNLYTLQSEWIILANGRQRQGQAGRSPASATRLYSRCRESSFAAHTVLGMS